MAAPTLETPIGITMGTHQIAGCVMDHNVAYLYFDNDHLGLPCVIAFNEDGYILGREAYDQIEKNPENTIYDIKRLLGRFYDDPEIKDYLKEWPFKVIENENRPKYEVKYKGEVTTFFPEEIVALFFQRIKEHAENHLCRTVTDAVITVPAQFNPVQRQSTIDAAKIAGLNVLQVINETTAVAVVYGVLRPQFPGEGDRNIAVVSAGSGFLDVSLITYGDRVFECKGTRGMSIDINRTIAHHFANKIRAINKVDVLADKTAYIRLWKAIEEAKCKVGYQREVPIIVDAISPGVNFDDVLTHQDVEEILSEVLDDFRSLFSQCMNDIGWNPSSVHEYIMAGGSATLPCIFRAFRNLADTNQRGQIVPDPQLYAVAGTAMRAASLTGCTDFGLEDLVTLDIASKTVGIMTREGKCRPFVRHNDNVPHWATKEYTTSMENQDSFYIDVYEGDSMIAAENKFVGKYRISGFPIRKRGKTHIRVTFQLNHWGLLVIEGEDRSPGVTDAPVVVHNESGLILEAELPKIMDAFRERFPPAPIPVPTNGHHADQPDGLPAVNPLPQLPINGCFQIDMNNHPNP